VIDPECRLEHPTESVLVEAEDEPRHALEDPREIDRPELIGVSGDEEVQPGTVPLQEAVLILLGALRIVVGDEASALRRIEGHLETADDARPSEHGGVDRVARGIHDDRRLGNQGDSARVDEASPGGDHFLGPGARVDPEDAAAHEATHVRDQEVPLLVALDGVGPVDQASRGYGRKLSERNVTAHDRARVAAPVQVRDEDDVVTGADAARDENGLRAESRDPTPSRGVLGGVISRELDPTRTAVFSRA
jgi:hypothetical protein